jgi:ketosteroid isomerase-like protein
MDAVTEAVLAANAHFYRALSLADFSAMQSVWLASPDAVCAHPGQPLVRGWDAIRESWRDIFLQQGLLHVWPTETLVRLYGQTAEVNCFENIDLGQVAGGGLIRARAVNIFRRAAEAWKLLEHHAWPMPHDEPQPLERFSSN